MLNKRKQVIHEDQIFILEAMKMSVLSRSEITANATANYFNKAGFLQNVSLEEDEHFNKLKLSLNQCQQHNKDCVSEGFSNDNLLTVMILLQ